MDDHDDLDDNDMKNKPFKLSTPSAVTVPKRQGKSKNNYKYEKSKFTSVRKLFGKEEKKFYYGCQENW